MRNVLELLDSLEVRPLVTPPDEFEADPVRAVETRLQAALARLRLLRDIEASLESIVEKVRPGAG